MSGYFQSGVDGLKRVVGESTISSSLIKQDSLSSISPPLPSQAKTVRFSGKLPVFCIGRKTISCDTIIGVGASLESYASLTQVEVIMPRLFVALVPPASVRRELAAVAANAVNLRTTPEENFHLTLRYIGAVHATNEEKFIAALGRVTVEPFILPVCKIGVFPIRGPAKVLWAGVGNGHTRLFQLRKQVDEALLSVDMTIEVHHFHPHFTLGRLGENYETKVLAKFLEHHAGFEAPPFRVREFQLMSSESQPARAPHYRCVHVFPLGDPGAA